MTQCAVDAVQAFAGRMAQATFDKPASPGTYYWIASYSGDDNNNGVSGACGDDGETSIVKKDSPSIATVASNATLANAAVVGTDTISDTATVSGGDNPTGSVDFTVYKVDPQAPVCDQTTPDEHKAGLHPLANPARSPLV